MSTQSVNREINIFIQSGEAEKVYDRLIQKEKSLNDELAKTADPKRIKVLQAELAKLAEPIDRAAKKVKGELSPALKDMQSTVAKLGAQLSKMSKEDADYSKVVRQYAQARAELAAIQQESLKVEQAHKQIAATNPFGKVLDYAKGAFLGGGLLGIVSSGISTITNFIKGAFDEAFSAEENAARLKATLDNLGRSDAFDRLSASADELANRFKYLDNDDITAVFERLINYGKLTEQQMNDLLPVIIDFAAKQRIPIEEASTAIIGALEGQGKALKQYGINIKDGGNEAERLNIIMTTLKSKVDGAGEAFQKTTVGGLAVAQQQFANLKEEVGNRLLPVFNGVLGFFTKFIKGISDLVPVTKSATEEFDDLNGKVQHLNQNISPLLTRYDQLKEKTNLSKKEQAEMKSIIDQVVQVMPGAVTQFDKYGNAIAISTGRVREFIDAEKARLKVVNADAVRENQKTLEGINSQIANVEKRAQEIAKTGTFLVPVKSELDGSIAMRKARQNEIAEVERNYKELLEKRKGYQAEIERLNGTSLQKQLDAQAEAEAKKNKNKVLGTGSDDPGTSGNPKTLKDKTKDEYADFLKDFQKLQDQVALIGLDEQEKELLALTQKYDEMRKRAAGHKADLLKLDELYFSEYTVVLDKFAQKDIEKFEKEDAARKQRAEKLTADITKDVLASSQKFAARIAAEVDKENRNNKAGLELQILQARGQKRLDLELKLMDEEKRQALQKKDLTENEKLVIEEQYRQKRLQAEMQFQINMVNQFASFAQQGLDILATIDGAKAARENAELERDRRNNEKKKTNYERQLKAGLLTKMDFDRKVADLDKKAEEKEKQAQIDQFNREKKLKRASIALNGIQAVTKTLSEFGPPIPPNFLGIVAMAFTVGSVAAQLIALNKEKPQFARGGQLKGPSHRGGGIQLFSRSGRYFGEAEGGEGIINKHSMADRNTYTVSGTPSQIASRINALRGGVQWASGATLAPGWRTATPSRMNFNGIRQRFYAQGGVVNGSADGVGEENNVVMVNLANSIADLNTLLANGIWAKVLLSQFNEQQQRLEALRNDTVIK